MGKPTNTDVEIWEHHKSEFAKKLNKPTTAEIRDHWHWYENHCHDGLVSVEHEHVWCLLERLETAEEINEALDFSWEVAKQRWHKAEAAIKAVQHCLDFYVETQGTVSLREALQSLMDGHKG